MSFRGDGKTDVTGRSFLGPLLLLLHTSSMGSANEASQVFSFSACISEPFRHLCSGEGVTFSWSCQGQSILSTYKAIQPTEPNWLLDLIPKQAVHFGFRQCPSWLDYCSALLSGLPVGLLLMNLRIQRAAVCLVFKQSKQAHVTLYLMPMAPPMNPCLCIGCRWVPKLISASIWQRSSTQGAWCHRHCSVIAPPSSRWIHIYLNLERQRVTTEFLVKGFLPVHRFYLVYLDNTRRLEGPLSQTRTRLKSHFGLSGWYHKFMPIINRSAVYYYWHGWS